MMAHNRNHIDKYCFQHQGHCVYPHAVNFLLSKIYLTTEINLVYTADQLNQITSRVLLAKQGRKSLVTELTWLL